MESHLKEFSTSITYDIRIKRVDFYNDFTIPLVVAFRRRQRQEWRRWQRRRQQEAAAQQQQQHFQQWWPTAGPDWCPTAGQHSDVESEHGLVEENVAVLSRRRCSTLTERRHAAGASLAEGAPDTTSERRISLRVGHSRRRRASGESSIQGIPRLFLSQTSIRMVCVLANGAIVETRHVVERPAAKRSRSEEQSTGTNKKHKVTEVDASTANTATDSDHGEPGFLVDPG